MSNTNKLAMIWYTDYLGIGYARNTKGWFVFPIFSSPSNAQRVWNDQIEHLDERSLKMRFVEYGSEYRFILYPYPLERGRVNFGFYRRISSSETYNVFKRNFSGKVFFTFGTLGDGSRPNLFHESKLVSDIEFMKNTELKKNSVEWLAEQVQQQMRGDGNE